MSSLGSPFRGNIPSNTSLPFDTTFINDLQSDVAQPITVQNSQNSTTVYENRTGSSSLHLLIPASKSNENLCKTLLSSFVLNYPSPTLINFGEVFTGTNWDNGSHAGKINGVYNFLSNDKKVRDDDLVLIIDGYDVWFQLPPEVLVKRYLNVVRIANERLKQRYGMITRQKPWEGLTKQRVQRFSQTIVFGADKLCWPNAIDSPACSSLPPSSLPPDAYGPMTDKDSEGFKNRPKYLNSGNVIGPVADVRAVYKRAMEKIDQGLGGIGDQFVFAEILGEQELQRESTRRSTQNMFTRWLEWHIQPLGINSLHTTQKSSASIMLDPNQRYEFSIGLDYSSSLFHTMTHSSADIAFTTHNITSHILPIDVLTARPPFPGLWEPTAAATKWYPPFSPTLDIPPQTISNQSQTWSTLPLALNNVSHTVPALLHINGDKSLLQSSWPQIWFQPYGRALLRAYKRTPQPFLWGVKGQQQRIWDRRGGRGGIWTTEANWMGWEEICKGCEDNVFADGKGIWGKEEGDGRVYNYWGKVVIGDEVEEEKKDETEKEKGQ